MVLCYNWYSIECRCPSDRSSPEVQSGAPALAAPVGVLSTHGCPRLQHHQVHMAFAAPSPLAFASLVLFCKTVGKCLSLLTPYAYRWCPMAKWPVSPVIAGCNTRPKQAGDSGLEESQSTQDYSFLTCSTAHGSLTHRAWILHQFWWVILSGALLAVTLLQSVLHFTFTLHSTMFLLWMEFKFFETFGSHRSLGHG